MENIKKSIMDMAGGAIKERADYEISRIVDNILDPNTDEKKKRKLTLTIDFTPSDDRSMVTISAVAKSTLCPACAIEKTLVVTGDENGVPILAEAQRQIPGQMNMEGQESPEPEILSTEPASEAPHIMQFAAEG